MINIKLKYMLNMPREMEEINEESAEEDQQSTYNHFDKVYD